MNTHLVTAARKYLNDAHSRNVMAVQPQALARHLNCGTDEALQMLVRLRAERLVDVRAFATCPDCHEHTPLSAGSPDAIDVEASRLAGRACKWCGTPFPADESYGVTLSFFCTAVAWGVGAAAKPNNGGDSANCVTLSVGELKELIALGDSTSITASDGANIAVGSTFTQMADGNAAVQTVTNGNSEDNAPWYKRSTIWASLVGCAIIGGGSILAAALNGCFNSGTPS